jgi:hypothetical protein
MTIPYDHNAIKERIWTQFQDSPLVIAVLEKLFIEPANMGELLLELAGKHNIVDGTDTDLDDIGEMLDLTREQLGGVDDEAYRFALIIRARSIFAGGTIPDFTSLLRALLPDYPNPIPVIEWFPANVRVYLQDITPEQAKLFKALLAGVLPAAGVGAGIIVADTGPYITFSCSHGPVDLLGWFGSSHGPTSTEAGWRHIIVI